MMITKEKGQKKLQIGGDSSLVIGLMKGEKYKKWKLEMILESAKWVAN